MRGLFLILIWTVLALPAAIFVFPWTWITRDTTVLFRVGFWIARAGLPLLDSVLDAYAAGRPAPLESAGEPSYFSLPTRAAVARFRRQGRRFF